MDDEMTPSRSIIASANETVELKTPSGRRLTYKKLSVLDQIRLMRAMGEHSSNQMYALSVQVAASIVAIDGRPLPFPTSEKGIDSAISRLGDEGYATAQAHVLGEIQRAKQALMTTAENDDEPDADADSA
ncbi:hypothetical protein FHR90_003251 [Endobacter medicaginis]|uniref:Uncharacterized protein n=1 Tax=Endobacter medicaginis TaxID=1181271 RepID=A0A850NK98_9PROT|nr:hypothetical protein [Endobacter medicaginis]MBB3175396.1 hypothetical protein [Endobacter medicaginis]MCX5476738.1 hypothetical protein [Endobacter medicaginis]NVN29344.1 hypothetical protein [Endobacter medicaginis]